MDSILIEGAKEDYNIEWVREALQHGANVNAILPSDLFHSGITALMAASYGNNVCIMKLLIENGADVNIKTKGGTALILAARSNSIDAAILLIDHTADINAVDSEGKTPLMYAKLYKYEEMKRILIDKKFRLIKKNNDHHFYGSKWGACSEKKYEKSCRFDPYDKCQFPKTEATITYKFIADGVSIDIKGTAQSIIDIDKFYNKLGYKNINYKSLIRSAFKTWDNCSSGIKFKEVNDSDTTADIRIGLYGPLPVNKNQIPPHALSYQPPYPEDISKEYFGDIFFNTVETTVITRNKNELKRRFYLVALHEIGHAIGLKHNDKEESIMTDNSEKLFLMKGISYADTQQASNLYGIGGQSIENCIPLKEHIERIRKRWPLKASL